MAGAGFELLERGSCEGRAEIDLRFISTFKILSNLPLMLGFLLGFFPDFSGHVIRFYILIVSQLKSIQKSVSKK